MGSLAQAVTWRAFADSCGRDVDALPPSLRVGCEGAQALRRRHGSTVINGVVAFEGYDPSGAPQLQRAQHHISAVARKHRDGNFGCARRPPCRQAVVWGTPRQATASGSARWCQPAASWHVDACAPAQTMRTCRTARSRCTWLASSTSARLRRRPRRAAPATAMSSSTT